MEYHQPLPEPRTTRSGLNLALQCINRLPGRQNKGGITSGEYSGYQYHADQRRNQSHISPEIQCQILLDQIVKHRQHRVRDNKCQQRRETGDNQGFSQKLLDQLTATGADHFSQAHLSCAPDGLGCRQIHKIHAGNDQNKCGNHTHRIELIDIAEALDVVICPRMQIDPMQRLEMIRIVFLDFRAHIARYKIRKFLFQCFGRNTFLKQNISLYRSKTRSLIPNVPFVPPLGIGVSRYEHIKWDCRRIEAIFQHAPHNIISAKNRIDNRENPAHRIFFAVDNIRHALGNHNTRRIFKSRLCATLNKFSFKHVKNVFVNEIESRGKQNILALDLHVPGPYSNG